MAKSYKEQIEFDYKINTKNAVENIRVLQKLITKTSDATRKNQLQQTLEKQTHALKKLNAEYVLYEKRLVSIKEKMAGQKANQNLFSSGFVKPSQYLKQALSNANMALSNKREKLMEDAAAAEAKGDTETAKKLKKEAGQTALKQKGMNMAFQAAAKAAQAVGKAFKKLVSGVADVVKSMLDLKSGVATYSMSGSLISNASARETQLKYGLTGSQAYAFDQARSMLNITSDEDLMYMNEGQREKLLAYMERYSAWYDQMEQSGVLANIQEMQLEFQEFKQEIAMEFLQWVAENKDTIMAVLKGVFEFIKTIANIVLGIANILSLGRYKSTTATSDTLSSNVNNNQKNTNVTINANTTNNANVSQASQNTFNEMSNNQWNQLAKQIVTAVR